jgi:hypothetical protein
MDIRIIHEYNEYEAVVVQAQLIDIPRLRESVTEDAKKINLFTL